MSGTDQLVARHRSARLSTVGEQRAEVPRPASEARFNRIIGPLLRLGIGPRYMYLLEVPGRRSGRLFTVPINLMEVDGNEYIVAPRGNVQWVRNLRATDRFVLRRGLRRINASASEIDDADKPALLRIYLQRYAATRQYFPVAVDAGLEAFVAIAGNYPVFRLMRID